jgi:hypothetical protein
VTHYARFVEKVLTRHLISASEVRRRGDDLVRQGGRGRLTGDVAQVLGQRDPPRVIFGKRWSSHPLDTAAVDSIDQRGELSVLERWAIRCVADLMTWTTNPVGRWLLEGVARRTCKRVSVGVGLTVELFS